MRLLDRYLLRELLIWLGFVLVGLLIAVIACDLFQSLNRFQEHKLLWGDILFLYVAKLPAILVAIVPVVLLISLLSALTNHARHNELTAIRAAGIGLWRICTPYFVVGFLLGAAIFILNETYVPDTEAKVAQIMESHSNIPGTDPDILVNLGFPNARDNRNWLIGAYYRKTDVMINPKVNWQDEGAKWQLLARRAERIHGIWTFFGYTAFGTNDIADLESLVGKLRPKTATNGVSRYLSSQLSPATMALFQTYHSGNSPDLQRALADDLDHIIRQGSLYDSDRFAGAALSPDTETLIDQKPEGTMLIELNRMLLLDAYPHELARYGLNTVRVWKGEGGDNFQMIPYVSTNILAMPKFGETPREFVNEAKFNSRFQKLSATSAEVPIVELLDYARLHPDLNPQKQRWLRTQLHARLAMPWSCVVVVLIAVPFGGASGRRNIFMGVAGSIIICFAYFILLRIGLALGTGGFLPPWIAAWLPNAFFGITGFWLMLRVR